MEQRPIFLHQVSYYSLCMLETHLLKKQCPTILTINLSNKRKVTFFGKHTQEEEPLIIFLMSLRIYSLEWLPLTHKRDQKFRKLLLINGSREQFALTDKLNNSSALDNRN